MDAISAVSNITSTITWILQGVESIQLARSFGDDLRTHQIQLNLISLRLSRWAQATGILKPFDSGGDSKVGKSETPENPDQAQNGSYEIEDNAEAIEDILDEIKKALKKASEEATKMNPKAEGGNDAAEETGDELSPPRFKRLQLRIRHIVSTRCDRAGDHWKGVKWVLYKKDQCEALTTRIIELLGQLEKLATSEEKLTELGREECEGLGDSLKTLVEAAGGVDKLLVGCATQKIEGDREARGVSVSAGVNYGIQNGVNYGSFKGLSFGTGNTITNQWGKD